MTRDKALTAYALKRYWYGQLALAELERQGALFPVEVALLAARLQAHNGAPEKAQRTLGAVMEHGVAPSEQFMLVEAMVTLLMASNQEEEARQVLDRERERLPAEAVTVLEGVILLPQGLSSTASHFQVALQRFPRRRTLIENLLVFLHALLKRLRKSSGGIAPGADALCHEALGYARRLAQLLPSPEARFLEAYWTSESGDVPAPWHKPAPCGRITRRARWRYITRTSFSRRGIRRKLRSSWMRSWRATRTIRTGLAVRHRIGPGKRTHRAIEVLELLIGHPSEGVELYINLALAQLHAAAAEPYRAGTAFDLLLEAFRKYPMEQTLPARSPWKPAGPAAE